MSTYIIAEAGVNHNGSEQLAHDLVDAAADAGADAVKFQTFKASELATASVSKAKYQRQNQTNEESQYQMLERLELRHDLHFDLKAHAEQRGIDFMSTAFDTGSLQFLVSDLSLETIKISSGELTNHPFLLAHARTGKKLILSTGMATLDEIKDALAVLSFGFLQSAKSTEAPTATTQNGYAEAPCPPTPSAFLNAYDSEHGKQLLKERLTLLHCTSEYPTSMNNVNLRVMQSLQEQFGVCVGYSDHTLGVVVAGLAVAAGARVLEKHFTLDQSMPGPDHAMSMTPESLARYVATAREAELVMGSAEKMPTIGELQNRTIGRKVIVAASAIVKGEVFSDTNIGLKRSSGTGLEPSRYWELLGKQAAATIERDEAITDLLIL
ncbi:N-acetylneuraminate synthase [Granulosicoccus antarcticus]|uniref:N,N'-diacetyllegionaminic acid synthase n=1 Tax=Granulosicoccus antarcticus IMCC3135 TaxID=1192854 RepID=A0A2Z2NWW4_9GAMM|nr:N-acetylneuraminate synthase [Granulosicoccus antarcticus]ASJ74925.1 N,N'-diacetyllegionaminic acid synthase [Granulosicoccus antarcticus IMCC3135]